MSVCGYIRIYLAVYGPEIIGGFGQNKKAVCGLRKRNYGGLRNMRPPIIDPLGWRKKSQGQSWIEKFAEISLHHRYRLKKLLLSSTNGYLQVILQVIHQEGHMHP